MKYIASIDDLHFLIQSSKLSVLAARLTPEQSNIALKLCLKHAKNGHALYLSNVLRPEEINQRIEKFSLVNQGHIEIMYWEPMFTCDFLDKVRSSLNKHSIIILDLLQYMRPRGRQNFKRSHSKEILKGLKLISEQFNIPVVVLSGMNRRVENRKDRRPRVSDLRQMGCALQYVDLLALLYDDNCYRDLGLPLKEDALELTVHISKVTPSFLHEERTPFLV